MNKFWRRLPVILVLANLAFFGALIIRMKSQTVHVEIDRATERRLEGQWYARFETLTHGVYSTFHTQNLNVDDLITNNTETFAFLSGGTSNDLDLWAATGVRTSRVEIDISASSTISGIVAGNEGDVLWLWNGGGTGTPDTITLLNGSTLSAHDNRIWIANGKELNIPNNDGVLLIYDGHFGWTVFGGATTIIRAQELSIEPVMSPSALTAGTSTNNYNPWGSSATTSNVRQDVSGTGVATITGILVPGAPNPQGRVLVFTNISTTASIVFTCNDTNSVSDNEISCPNSAPIQLGLNESVTLFYDSVVNTWRAIAYATNPTTPNTTAPTVLPTDPTTPFNDWHPAGLGQYPVIPFQAGDNHGNLVTGIDATAIPLGYTMTVCNVNAPQDDGIIGFAPEDTRSIANNRIWTPGYGRNTSQINDTRYTIGPSECATFRYSQVDPTTPSTHRWVFDGPVTRQAQTVIKQLGFFPFSTPAAATGTVNDYAGDDTCPAVFGPLGGSCEGASDVHFETYTVVYVTSVDSTGLTLTGMQYAPNGQQNQAGMGPVKILFNAGPGNLTLINNSGASAVHNKFLINNNIGNDADTVLQPGQAMMFYHLPATGEWQPLGHDDYYFGGRDVTMSKGLSVSGVDAAVSIAGTTMFVDQSLNNRTTSGTLEYVRDVGTYNTTAAGIGATGVVIAQDGTRASGGNNLTNVALLLDASGGQVNYALQVTAGNEYHGLGSKQALDYYNTSLFDVSDTSKFETNVYFGGGDFGGTTHQAIAQASTVPSANHGSLDASSTNFIGRVASATPNTQVTLTFGGGGFGTTAFCFAQPEGGTTGIYMTPSATAPVFNCFSYATGGLSACPNFSYQCWGH